MRFLLKVTIPVESGNAAAKAGKLGATIQSILADLKPEAVTTLRPKAGPWMRVETRRYPAQKLSEANP